jgi:hypothetical protein
VGRDGSHLKLTLFDGTVTWDGIAFRQGEWARALPEYADLVYHLELNEWRGTRRLQLNVQELRPATNPNDGDFHGADSGWPSGWSSL